MRCEVFNMPLLAVSASIITRTLSMVSMTTLCAVAAMNLEIPMRSSVMLVRRTTSRTGGHTALDSCESAGYRVGLSYKLEF